VAPLRHLKTYFFHKNMLLNCGFIIVSAFVYCFVQVMLTTATTQRFIKPGNWGFNNFLTIVMCSVVVLIIVYYFSSINIYDNILHLTSLEQHGNIWHATTLNNYSNMYSNRINLVWPHKDGIDNYDDRIQLQIDVMNIYAYKNRSRKLKVILRVGKFNFKNWVDGQEQFVRDKCPIVDCWLTHNQSHAPDADALLISEFRQSSRKHYLPKPRRQIWIAQHQESPRHNRIDPRSVRDLINWTASYRHDSTIAFGRRFVKLVPSVPPTKTVISGGSNFNYAIGKTKLVAWFVSNCHAKNNRRSYARQLSRFVQV